MRFAVLILCLAVCTAMADYVVSWSHGPLEQNPAYEPSEYRIYKVEGGQTNEWSTRETMLRFADPTNGPVKIWVTVYTGDHRESDPSEVLTYDPSEIPNAPQNLRLK